MLGNNHNNATNTPAYDAHGNPVGAHGHHNASTGGGIASKIPGTDAHAATHGQPHGTAGGLGHGTNTAGTSGGGIASKIPGTAAHDATHGHAHGTTGPTHGTTGAGYGTTGTGYGTTGTVAPDSHVGGHHNTTHASSGAGTATKIESKIPGTDAHKATHPPHHGTTTGTGHVGGTHTGTTHGAHGAHGSHQIHDTTTHGHHAASGAGTTTASKPSVTDKIGGKIDVAIGKMTKNQEKVVEGEIKQTEGKAGLANAGLAGNNTTATGATRY